MFSFRGWVERGGHTSLTISHPSSQLHPTHVQHFPPINPSLPTQTSQTSQLTPPLYQLYESNARPHLYWFVAKFFKRKGDSQPNYYRPSDTPGLFWREFILFKHFFEKKTGIPWEKRLILCNPATRIADVTPTSGVEKEEGGLADEKALVDGDSKKEIWYKLEDEGRRFVYEPPVSFWVGACCWAELMLTGLVERLEGSRWGGRRPSLSRLLWRRSWRLPERR